MVNYFELVENLFGPDENLEVEEVLRSIPENLVEWLIEVGQGYINPAELIDFANEKCLACNGVSDEGEPYGHGDICDVIVTLEGSESLWAWCTACYWHKQECLEGCGPVVVESVFYLPFHK